MKDLWRRVWRADAYLLAALVSGLATLVLLPLTLAVALTVAAGGIGLVLLSWWFRGLGAWARLHLRHASSVLDVPVPEAAFTPARDIRSLPRSRTARRLLAWMPLFAPSGLGTGLVAVLATGSVLEAALSLRDGERRAQAHRQRLRETGPGALRHRPPAGPRGARLSGGAVGGPGQAAGQELPVMS
ncbi:hypothetical protein BJF83_03045 [Nocardiopsis sp. CNR-923]|nr:hypothetical protein BJF83_03045 [Nocardiopsis sp. CNR-923]